MDQLILDVNGAAVLLPEATRSRYAAWEEDQSVPLEMIAGNMVLELRGVVWKVSYECDYLTPAMKDRVLSACLKGRREPIICSFLVPKVNQTLTSEFFVTAFTQPKYQWSRRQYGTPQALWAGFALELREVDPHA